MENFSTIVPDSLGMEGSDREGEGGLSVEQTELLVQLQELTGLEDLQVCRALLESRDWDLEAVVQEQLGLGGGGEPTGPSAAPVPPQPAGRAGAVWAPARNTLGWLLHLVALPARIFTGGLGAVWSFVTSLLGLPTESGRAQAGSGDPRQDVATFITEFEARYGSEHPPFHRGGYHAVLEQAKQELRFLVVYLHSEEHQDTDRFCQEVLSSQAVRDQLAASNALLWGCSVSRPEGYRVSQVSLANKEYTTVTVTPCRRCERTPTLSWP